MDQYEVNTQLNLQSHIQYNRFNTQVIIVIYLIFCTIIGFAIDIIQGMVTENLSLTWAIKSLILFGRPIYAAKLTTLLGIFVLFFFMYFIIKLSDYIRREAYFLTPLILTWLKPFLLPSAPNLALKVN